MKRPTIITLNYVSQSEYSMRIEGPHTAETLRAISYILSDEIIAEYEGPERYDSTISTAPLTREDLRRWIVGDTADRVKWLTD